MKTQNTLENKAMFFAQYWGQKVFKTSINQEKPHKNNFGKTIVFKDFLELTSLSQISDEDAIELMRLKIVSKGVVDIETIEIENKTLDGYTFIVKYKNWDDERVGFVFNGHTNPLSFYDYLRSKGFAVPWMDLEVEDLVEYGWIKLKEN